MPPKPLEYIYPGILAAQAIHTAVELKIPDLLALGPKSAVELAAACEAHAPTLERLLRALTSIDIFQRTEDGRYRNSPFTEVLRRDHPQTLWAETMFLPAPFLWKPLGELSESVRTGEPAFDRVFGQNFFAHLGEHPDEAAVFQSAHDAGDSVDDSGAAQSLRFFTLQTGGGCGRRARFVFEPRFAAVPKLEGILFDQPRVAAGAKDSFKGDVAARVKIVGGSFFESVPSGGDAYVLRRIIHDWEDEEAQRILGNVRRAMSQSGTLLVVEGLIDSATHPAGLMDLLMLVLGGRERSEADFRALVEAAGFTLQRIAPAGNYSVIECRPV